MKIPRSHESAIEYFKMLLPKDPRIIVRPMFGNLTGFINGNMFTGLYGDDLFIRLFGDAREDLLNVRGASIFEPMKGRQMKNYIVVPKGWIEKPEITREWITKALEAASKLPKKKK